MRFLILLCSLSCVVGTMIDGAEMSSFEADVGVGGDDHPSFDDDVRFQLYAESITFHDGSELASRRGTRWVSPVLIAMETLHEDWNVSPQTILHRIHTQMPGSPIRLANAIAMHAHLCRLCVVPQWLYEELNRHTATELSMNFKGVCEGVMSIAESMEDVRRYPQIAQPVVWYWMRKCIIPQKVFRGTLCSAPRGAYRVLTKQVCQSVLEDAARAETRHIEWRLTAMDYTA